MIFILIFPFLDLLPETNEMGPKLKKRGVARKEAEKTSDKDKQTTEIAEVEPPPSKKTKKTTQEERKKKERGEKEKIPPVPPPSPRSNLGKVEKNEDGGLQESEEEAPVDDEDNDQEIGKQKEKRRSRSRSKKRSESRSGSESRKKRSQSLDKTRERESKSKSRSLSNSSSKNSSRRSRTVSDSMRKEPLSESESESDSEAGEKYENAENLKYDVNPEDMDLDDILNDTGEEDDNFVLTENEIKKNIEQVASRYGLNRKNQASLM